MSGADLPPLPENFTTLLAEDRAAADPGPEVRQRVLKRLAGVIVGGGGGGASGGGPGVAPTSVTGASNAIVTGGALGSKLLLVTAVITALGAAAAGVHLLSGEGDVRPPAPALAPVVVAAVADVSPSEPDLAPSVSRVEAVPVPVAPAPEPKRRVHRPAAAAPDRKATPPRQVERQLLLEAQTALAAGDPAAALVALERHSREYPTGPLTEERDALEVYALAEGGDKAATRAAAHRFLHRYPNSIHRQAVDAVLDRLQ